MFTESGPLLQRLDSIVAIIAFLTLSPLIINKQKLAIIGYFAVNSVIFVIFTRYSKFSLNIPEAVINEYLIDNLAAIALICTISYNIFTINKRALDKAHSAEMAMQSQNEELEASNEELESLNEELIRSENEIFENQEKYKNILENIEEGYFETDVDGLITFFNATFCSIVGYDAKELSGKNISFLKTFEYEDTINEFLQNIKSKKHHVKIPRYEIKRNDGSMKIVEIVASPLIDASGIITGYRSIVHDLTDRIKAERELLKTSKIESLGIFAGGIAHDFNNLLTAIMGNLSLTKININKDNACYEIVSDAEKASIRAKDLTQQLLTFSKGGDPIKKTASMRELLLDTAGFVLSGSDVKCNFEFSDDLWNVEIDKGQISQVIHNIVLNSRQAMPDGGIITIKAVNRIVKKDDGYPLIAGNYIFLLIEDEGTGIAEEDLPNIFDPFFTTREMGNGLGLSVTYSIIQKHGGYVGVDSAPGKGTTFEIFLPASTRGIIENEAVSDTIAFKHGRVLLMDDEEIVLKVAERMLKYIGFQVVKAKNGEEALEFYRQSYEQNESFDCVIMDLTIPGSMGERKP